MGKTSLASVSTDKAVPHCRSANCGLAEEVLGEVALVTVAVAESLKVFSQLLECLPLFAVPA